MTETAKLFTHGRSQAVRLPKEFRFEGREVRISKIGDRVILQPIEATDIPWDLIDQLIDKDFMAEGRDQTIDLSEPVRFDD